MCGNSCQCVCAVQSLSYGENEDSYSGTYQQRGDVELIKLGLRGVSVLVATGDTGVQVT